jgi:hypothetical protein
VLEAFKSAAGPYESGTKQLLSEVQSGIVPTCAQNEAVDQPMANTMFQDRSVLLGLWVPPSLLVDIDQVESAMETLANDTETFLNTCQWPNGVPASGAQTPQDLQAVSTSISTFEADLTPSLGTQAAYGYAG